MVVKFCIEMVSAVIEYVAKVTETLSHARNCDPANWAFYCGTQIDELQCDHCVIGISSGLSSLLLIGRTRKNSHTPKHSQ